MRSTLVRLAAAVAVLATLALGLAGPAGAAPDPTASAPGQTFGPVLNWATDDAGSYARRLGAAPGLYGDTIGYPLTAGDSANLDDVARSTASQGSLVLLALEPRTALTALTAADAKTLATRLAALTEAHGTRFLVEFAPDMNGSWTAWGQQPEAYVAAFRTVASVVHATTTAAAMVWAPAEGAGYPFGGARGSVTPSGPRVTAQLDTNGDGVVDAGDDPYAPYWPGDAAVDRVGLSVYWYGPADALGTNALPAAGRFAASLTGTTGYATPQGTGRDFVARWSVAHGKPMLVETGALYVPSAAPGPGQLAIQQAWWKQVFGATTRSAFPTLDMVAWFEVDRTEAESSGALVDWRVTDDTTSAAAFRAAVAAAGYGLGPVPTTTVSGQANASVAQAYTTTGGDQSVRIVVGVLILLGLFLLAGAIGRWRPTWTYRPGAGRDDRLDWFRGFIIVLVVVTHIEVAGPYSYFALRLGAITGAEMFVLLSGLVLGMVYPLAVRAKGQFPAAVTMLRRALRLWVTTIAIVLIVFALSKIPHLDVTSITTFTDRGTGAGGEAAAGRVYGLYGTANHLLDYPPPWYAIRDLLLVRIGPWPINIMGLFVVLSLAVPAAMWLVMRRLWWVLLALSWALYVFDAVHPVHLFGSQFEDVFPLLTWQIAFTHGLVLGYYRRQVTAALTGRLGKIVVAAVLGVYACLLVLVMVSGSLGFDVPGLGPDGYGLLYQRFYERTYLEPGRLVDLAAMIVVSYAVLTSIWTPLHRAFGWFFVPLGRSSLYVFIVQVFLVLLVALIPGLDRASVWQGLLVHTGALALVWVMVRTRFLFRVVPN